MLHLWISLKTQCPCPDILLIASSVCETDTVTFAGTHLHSNDSQDITNKQVSVTIDAITT